MVGFRFLMVLNEAMLWFFQEEQRMKRHTDPFFCLTSAVVYYKVDEIVKNKLSTICDCWFVLVLLKWFE